MNVKLLAIGIIWGIIGIHVFFFPKSYSSKFERYIDFTGFNKTFSIVLVGVSIAFIYKSFSKRYNIKTLICPKCEEVFTPEDPSRDGCPKCGSVAEPLKGFYNRHPERK